MDFVEFQGSFASYLLALPTKAFCSQSLQGLERERERGREGGRERGQEGGEQTECVSTQQQVQDAFVPLTMSESVISAFIGDGHSDFLLCGFNLKPFVANLQQYKDY